MGGMWCKGVELYEVLGELAGRKAGLALTSEELLGHLPEDSLPPIDAPMIRIRQEEFEALARTLLHRLGALQYNSPYSHPTLDMRAVHRGAKARRVIETITEAFIACGARSGNGPVDLGPLFTQVLMNHGKSALPLLKEFHSRLIDHMTGSTISSYRRVEWSNIEELAALFDSEGVRPAHGSFIDQRYLDYLSRNHAALDTMNWRKFEALTAEFFDRLGFRVALGEGRDDGGVDARVWHPSAPPDAPPLLLVQCKRQKKKVGKVIVKSLWADVVNEGAASGLIVTTSELEPGAAQVAVARAYPVSAIERANLHNWLECLRTPGTGILLFA